MEITVTNEAAPLWAFGFDQALAMAAILLGLANLGVLIFATYKGLDITSKIRKERKQLRRMEMAEEALSLFEEGDSILGYVRRNLRLVTPDQSEKEEYLSRFEQREEYFARLNSMLPRIKIVLRDEDVSESLSTIMAIRNEILMSVRHMWPKEGAKSSKLAEKAEAKMYEGFEDDPIKERIDAARNVIETKLNPILDEVIE